MSDANKDQTTPIELQKYLQGTQYPASRDDLVAKARENNAPPEVIDTLQSLPDDQFEGPPGVMKSYGQLG